jgi:hypothetical protein
MPVSVSVSVAVEVEVVVTETVRALDGGAVTTPADSAPNGASVAFDAATATGSFADTTANTDVAPRPSSSRLMSVSVSVSVAVEVEVVVTETVRALDGGAVTTPADSAPNVASVAFDAATATGSFADTTANTDVAPRPSSSRLMSVSVSVSVAVEVDVVTLPTETVRALDDNPVPAAPASNGATAALAAATSAAATGATVSDGATDTGPCTPSSPLMSVSVSVAVEVDVVTVATERVRALDDNPLTIPATSPPSSRASAALGATTCALAVVPTDTGTAP